MGICGLILIPQPEHGPLPNLREHKTDNQGEAKVGCRIQYYEIRLGRKIHVAAENEAVLFRGNNHFVNEIEDKARRKRVRYIKQVFFNISFGLETDGDDRKGTA